MIKTTNNDQTGDCHTGRDVQLLSDFDFNTTEIAVLEITRLICANYASSSNDYWDLAHQQAEKLWTPFYPNLLVGAIVGLTRAIKSDRRASFGYMSGTCVHCKEHICSDEIDLMRVLRAACQRDATKLLSAASMLAACKNPNNILRAAHHVSTLMVACPTQPTGFAEGSQMSQSPTLH